MLSPMTRIVSTLNRIGARPSCDLKPFKFIQLVEVGPRDGLQNEKKTLSPEVRSELIQRCIDSGLQNIEVGSFVPAKKIPQLAETNQVIQNVLKPITAYFSALVPNKKGYDEALMSSTLDEIVIFSSVTDAFNQKNIGTDFNSACERFSSFIPHAIQTGLQVRGSLSCCFHCPFTGKVDPMVVIEKIKRYMSMGIHTIDIADTIGKATPEDVDALLTKCVAEGIDCSRLAGHFHDSNGLAINNIQVALEKGVTTFHSSISGIGGCPFSPNRVGNVSTEAVLTWCQKNDIKVVSAYSEPDLHKVISTSMWLKKELSQE